MYDQTPNALAYLVLALWPVAAWLMIRRLGPARGVIATLLGGYLLLPPPPAGFDLPLLPTFSKDTIPSLAALGVLLARKPPELRLLPEGALARALLALLVFGPVLTVLTNGEPVVWGPVTLPALRLREAVGIAMFQGIALIPLLLGRAVLATEEGARALLWALLIGGLAYSLPMLLEVRLSPQINIWVYGFFQHLFEQMMRGDGFRPIVFLYHGLWAAFLAMTAVLAAAALARNPAAGGEAGGRRTVLLVLAGLWMLLTLVLCKSLASLLYALLFGPLMLLLTAGGRLRLAALLAALALLYPLAKGADLVPREAVVALAARIDPERANSLEFRFEQEDVLLERASEKPAFGWGLWGRHHVFDRESGKPLTITDGRWIVLIGSFGWMGFLAEFGLLALPLLLAWARMGSRDGPGDGPAPPAALAAIALILAVNLADLIPNATVTPLTWLMAGAVLGWAERPREAHARAPAFRTVL